jgi:chemotaxis protein histidine kinase CheA
LAHTVESLLDMARNGELNIDGQIIDIVLESVDVLKKMIRSIQDSLEKGEAQEGNASIEEVLGKVGYTIKMVEEGRKPLGEMLVRKGEVSQEAVTDISGRGVGTDVVKNRVEKLRGRVDVQSVPGKGATFTIRLPLTLAIMDGIIIKASSEKYIIPTLIAS